MPCNQRIYALVNFANVNPERLLEAINQLNLNWHVPPANVMAALRSGKLTIQGATQSEVDRVARQLKQKYAELTVAATAKKFNWQVKAITNSAGQKQFQMQKR